MVLHRKLPKARLVHNTRRFGGKLFKLDEWYIYKPAAKVAASTLKLRGYNVRITFRPKSEKPQGFPMCDLWYVWRRRD